MIILKSIRVRNFRAIREASFQPLAEGITGIFGSNGAGKTTFLAATLFALFGTKPSGASVASLRRTGSGKEECSASVVFIHLGQTVEVIRELKGSNNRVVVDIYVDGVPQTVTSVGAADIWINQRLGIDAAGFMTAFIVRQKELDALVNARPAERKQTIERLAGIETINEALKKARKDENVAKEVLRSLPGSETAIADAEAQVTFLNEKFEEKSVEKENLQNSLLNSQRAQKTLSEQLEVLRDLESQIFKDETLLNSLLNENETHTVTISKLAYLKDVADDFDIEGLRKQHQDVVSKLNTTNQSLNGLRVEKVGLENSLSDVDKKIDELNTFISNSSVSVEDEKQLLEKKANLSTSLETLTEERSSAIARREDLLESVKTLQHNTECPTCHSHLDNPQQLVESLTNMAEELSEKAAEAKKKYDAAYLEHSEIEIKLNDIKHLNSWLDEKENYEQRKTSIASQLAELPEETKFVSDLKDLETEKDKIAEIGLKARGIIEDRKAFAVAQTKLAENEDKINVLESQLFDTRKNFSPTKFSELKVRLSQTQTETDRLAINVNEIFSEFSAFESRLAIANNSFKSVTEQWRRKKDLLSAQEKKALTTELIEKFRQESVASLAPELSEYATGLISDITNGSYTEVRLDDDFNVSVVSANGDVRNVAWLSGGEESAVAFALRLAIAFLITGGNPALLWLDEVLTAQDQDRRTAMLATIRRLPIDQIIVINHTAEASDIVDKAVTVIPNLTLGSTLESDDDGVSGIVPVDDLDSIADEDDFF